jgi:uncharacterized Zn finger protein
MAESKQKKSARAKEPVVVEGRKLAKTWWGTAWNENLERYADYENRIGRGRTYVRRGSVVDLRIAEGVVEASVQGSRRAPYKVVIHIKAVSDSNWKQITKRCAHRIGNLESLLSGQFPDELADLFLERGTGLFPEPKEISFSCSCPDWASMCKHVAASLYGVGTRFDSDPMLFFRLRNIDMGELLQKTMDEKIGSMLKNAGSKTERTLGGKEAKALFGFDDA